MNAEELQDAIYKVTMDADQEAFEKIYLNYCDKLFGLAFTIVKSEPLAEEIYNDVMLNIWQNRSKLVFVNNFPVYLYVSVKNKSLRALSNLNKKACLHIEDMTVEFTDRNPTPEDNLIFKETSLKLKSAIDQLSPQCRLIFKMVKEDGLKYKEVADILNTTTKNIEYHMGNAFKKISSHLSF